MTGSRVAVVGLGVQPVAVGSTGVVGDQHATIRPEVMRAVVLEVDHAVEACALVALRHAFDIRCGTQL